MPKIKYAWGFFIFFLSSSSVFASTPWIPDSFQNFVVSAAIGPNWAHTNNTHLVVSPYETDSMVQNNIANHTIWKLGVGYHLFTEQLSQRSFLNDLLLELNLYQSSETINGAVWQYQLPQFNNFSFSAPITSTRLMLDVKPGLFSQKCCSRYAINFSLYPIVGMGVAWNDVAYNESITGAGTPAASNYLLNSTTNSNFAYDLGVGLRADITDHLGVSLEYLYSNLGDMTPSSTSKNSNAIVSAPTFNIYNQSVLLGISWKI